MELQSSQLNDHGQILNALLTGKDHLKVEVDGMKISNKKEFGTIKGKISKLSSSQELLRKFTWDNMEDIHRIKNTMGMN